MAIVAAVAVLVLATPACAQLLRPPTDPQSLQQPRKAPMTLTPSVTVSEEFNDNVFLDNTRKEWDLITRITPGVSFEVGEPTRHPELDHFFDAHSLIADALWKATSRLTLNAFETFTLTTDTNLVSQESVATGRNRSYSNYIGAGASYQLDRLTTVRGGGSWILQRFQSDGLFTSPSTACSRRGSPAPWPTSTGSSTSRGGSRIRSPHTRPAPPSRATAPRAPRLPSPPL